MVEKVDCPANVILAFLILKSNWRMGLTLQSLFVLKKWLEIHVPAELI